MRNVSKSHVKFDGRTEVIVELCLRMLIIVWERSAASFLRLNVPDFRSFPTLQKMSYDC